MKKILSGLAFLLALNGVAQDNERWRMGVQWGLQGTESYLVSGSKEANARFQKNTSGGFSLGLLGRYDINLHWMFSVGLGISSYGFEYALAENYVAGGERKYSTIQSQNAAFETPLMMHYKFTPNCKRVKWLVGAGFSQNLVGGSSQSEGFVGNGEPSTNSSYLKSKDTFKGGVFPMLRFSVGREKLFRKGGILNLSLYLNAGFKEIAKSTVNYTVDGQEYTHEFGSKGNFVGLRLNYFFKSFPNQSGK